jgi:hypothetical protein
MRSRLIQPAYEPQFAEYESDIGEPTGTWRNEYAQKAKYAAAVQAVRVIGRRPVDWTKRDLLSGAFGDDMRGWFYRKVLQNNASFLSQDYDQIRSHGDKALIRESRAFDYSSRHHLYKLESEFQPDSSEWNAVAAAAFCPTNWTRSSNSTSPWVGARGASLIQ